MNVLYLVNFAGKAGIEKYVRNLTRLLPGAGGKPYFAYAIPGELSEQMAAAGVPSLQLSLEWKDALSAAKKLAAYCRENGIEVIHAQCPRENVIALLARRRLPELRVVYTEHFTRPCGAAWRMLYRHFTPKNHRVIALCRENREALIANGCCPDRIQVINNGIEPRQTKPRSDKLRRELALADDVFLIACLARLSPEKGVVFLADAMARLKQMTDRPFCCCVAGDGPLMEELQGRIAAAGLEKEFRLLGYRTDAEEILAGSDLYVCPSVNEALSFAILEAMNAGLPLVVTDVGGSRDLAEKDIVCGTAVPSGDTEAFAAAVLALMDDPALRETFSAAAMRKVAERYDLNKLARDVFNTYETEK